MDKDELMEYRQQALLAKQEIENGDIQDAYWRLTRFRTSRHTFLEDIANWEYQFYSWIAYVLKNCSEQDRDGVQYLAPLSIHSGYGADGVGILQDVFKMISILPTDQEKTQAVNEVCNHTIEMQNEMYQTYHRIDKYHLIESERAELSDMYSKIKSVKPTLINCLCSYSDDAAMFSGVGVRLTKAWLEESKSSSEAAKTYVEAIRKYEPDFTYAPPKPEEKPSPQKGGGCYVATAVYGSYDCPPVWTLRRYRDYTLAETWYGRAFIRTYYAISPALVKWFGKTEWFRNLWKPRLDRIVEKLNRGGVENTPYYDKNW